MSIVLVRIDNRLIHGQVLESWVPYVKADCIAVANDQVANNPLQKTLMAAAVPKGIRVIIDSLEKVAGIFSSAALIDCKILLLLANSRDALAIHRLGVAFARLNIGNMHGGGGTQRVACTMHVTPEDVLNFKNLEGEGVRIVSQCIPSDREQDWQKLQQKLGV